MANNFGPWATSIYVGSQPQLSVFWRRRMSMLVPASQTDPVLSRRAFVGLGAAGAAASLLPTLRAATAQATGEKRAADTKKGPGRIVLFADLKTKAAGTGAPQDVRGIIAIDPQSGRWEKLTGEGFMLRISPDGGKIVLTQFPKTLSQGSVIESHETWIHDLKTHQTVRVLDDGGRACWSPDGKQLAICKSRFTKDDKSDDVTWRVNLDGSGKARLPIPESDEVDDWSGDGRWFVTASNRQPPFGSGYQLYRMRPDGTEQLRLTKGGLNCYPRFSPDSRRIAYTHQTHAAGNSIRIVDIDGQNDREIIREEDLASVEAACWSPDGRQLAVVRYNWRKDEKGEKVLGGGQPGDENFRIEIMDADGTNRRELKLADATRVNWLGHADWR